MAWKPSISGALRHPELPAVLLLRSDRRWGLPRSVVAGDVWAGDADKAVEIIGRRLGTGVWVHRCLSAADHADTERLDLVFEASTLDPDAELPGNGKWVDRATLDVLALSDESRRRMLERYLDGLASGVVPSQRPPWCQAGWIDEVRPWIEANVGPHRVVGLDQIKQWSISSVLRVRTDGPTFYFKVSADLPLFVDEAVVVGRLAGLFPRDVLAPRAVMPDRGWMLFGDLGEIDDDPPPAEKEAAFRRLADLHLRSVPLTGEVLATGCHDRRLPVLEQQIQGLFADRRIMGQLPEVDRRLLRRNMGALAEMCSELEECGIPSTLVHGDFHMGNVGGRDGLIFDWTDACVSHPFFDLHSLAWEKPEVGDRLRAAYLEGWSGFPRARVQRALEISRTLLLLHHAVSYQSIADGLEPDTRPELDFAHDFLRSLVENLRRRRRPLQRVEGPGGDGVEDGGAAELAGAEAGGDLGAT